MTYKRLLKTKLTKVIFSCNSVKFDCRQLLLLGQNVPNYKPFRIHEHLVIIWDNITFINLLIICSSAQLCFLTIVTIKKIVTEKLDLHIRRVYQSMSGFNIN